MQTKPVHFHEQMILRSPYTILACTGNRAVTYAAGAITLDKVTCKSCLKINAAKFCPASAVVH